MNGFIRFHYTGKTSLPACASAPGSLTDTVPINISLVGCTLLAFVSFFHFSIFKLFIKPYLAQHIFPSVHTPS